MAKKSKKEDRKSKKEVKSTRKVEKATKAVKSVPPPPVEEATPHAKPDPKEKDIDFEINWENFEKVKAHFNLNDAECQEVLVATCGPNKQAEKYWDQFKKSPSPPSASASAAAPARATETKPAEYKSAQPPAPPNSVEPPAEPPVKKLRVSEAVDTLDSQPQDWEEWMSPDTEEDGDESISEVAQSKTSDDSPDAPSPAAAAVVEESPEVVCTAQKPDGELPREEIPVEDDLVKELEKEFELQCKKEILPVPTHPAKKKVIAMPPPPPPTFERAESLETLFMGAENLSGQASQVMGGEPASPGSTLGPSASQLPANDDKISDFVKAFTFLQTAMKEDWAKQLMTTLGSKDEMGVSEPKDEVEKARHGLPSSSRPTASAPKPVEPAKPVPSPAVEPTPASTPASAPPATPASAPAATPASAPAATPAATPASTQAADPSRATCTAPTAEKPTPIPATKEESEEENEVPDKSPSTKIVPAEVNSSTHRAEYARLSRKMVALGDDFPNASKLWNGSRKDKQELLAQWIRCGENIKVMETTLVIQRSQQGELTRGRELLTIAEMQSRGFSKSKIEALIKKGGEPDPDCPEDVASMRFWATTGASYQDKECSRVAMEAQAGINAGPDTLASMVGPVGCGGMEMAPAAALPAGAGGPSLEALVGVMNTGAAAAAPGVSAPAAKPKPKPKPKANPKDPKTPDDWRAAARNQCKREITACTTLAMELPPANPLRDTLVKLKESFEALLDELRDVSDDDLEDFFSKCSSKVGETRLVRAQARAVVSELKKAASSDTASAK